MLTEDPPSTSASAHPRRRGPAVLLLTLALFATGATWGAASSGSDTVPETRPEVESAPTVPRTPVAPPAEPDPFTRVDTESGVSFHKEMFLFPVSWSNRYNRDKTEVIFQLSAKLRILRSRFFIGYTQKSFWQAYNSDSAPFRDTNYNPEIFWRYAPSNSSLKHWGFDVGIEHESNGRGGEDSRSWNRAYFAVHYQSRRVLVYVKAWYRVDWRDECPKGWDDQELAICHGDPSYDDNPDILDYLGYGEANVYVRLTTGSRPQMLHALVRGNPATGKGFVSLDYSHPAGSRDLHWFFGAWSGYGESLLEYNRKNTRVGLGVLLRH